MSAGSHREVYDAVTAYLEAAPAHDHWCPVTAHADCCGRDADDCSCDLGPIRAALQAVVEEHRPTSIDHVNPCSEQHNGKAWRTRPWLSCPDCSVTTGEECRRCCRGDAACGELEAIAAALKVRKVTA